MKILIADNEVLSRRLLEETLQKAGYEVLAVENGTAAVQELCKPDGPRLATRLGNARTGRTRCVPRSSKKK